MERTLMRASLTWGAAETLLTLSWESSFCNECENQGSYSELGEFVDKSLLVLLSEIECFYSLHICLSNIN